MHQISARRKERKRRRNREKRERMAEEEEEIVAGLDEAGCGPAFGPLVAAACVLPTPLPPSLSGLDDSKRLTPSRRSSLAHSIRACCLHGVGVVSASEIDDKGLAWARRAVFHRALEAMVEKEGAKEPDRLVVDGTLFEPWRNVPFQCLPKADATVPCVSAASILAKVAHDSAIEEECDSDPTLDERYGLRSNKGYLTPQHIEGLRAHGRCDGHRRSFYVKRAFLTER